MNVSLHEPRCKTQPGTHPGIQPIRKAYHGGGVQRRGAGGLRYSGRATVLYRMIHLSEGFDKADLFNIVISYWCCVIWRPTCLFVVSYPPVLTRTPFFAVVGCESRRVGTRPPVCSLSAIQAIGASGSHDLG